MTCGNCYWAWTPEERMYDDETVCVCTRPRKVNWFFVKTTDEVGEGDDWECPDYARKDAV